jgi:hypothetical protein
VSPEAIGIAVLPFAARPLSAVPGGQSSQGIQFAFVAPGHRLFSMDVLTADRIFDHVPHPSFQRDVKVMELAGVVVG